MSVRCFALVVACSLLVPAIATAEGARYLIITPDDYESAVQPLAEWKTKKGMLAKVVPMSETGFSTVEMLMYIVDAYENWDPRPEFVLLVGDMYTLPMAILQGGYTDTYFGDVTGDTFIEIHPGRLPALNETQVITMVEKTLQYERYPTDDESFYLDALQTIAEDWDDDDWVHYYGDANWEAGLMMRAGYNSVEILTRGTTDDPTGTATDILNNGVSFAGFHGQISGTIGWYGFNIEPSQLTNGPMLPIVPTYTCQTMCTGSEGGGEKWMRAGSPGDLRGAVAYVGQSISCSGCAHWRSALRRGFYGYIFEDTAETQITTMGEAVEAGRLHYYEEIHSTQQYVASNLYGDPELNVWTAVPLEFDLSYPPQVPRGETEVTVSASIDGYPRQGVRVCLMGDEEAYAYGQTDETGAVTLAVDTSGDSLLHITATGRNLMPIESEMGVGTGEPVADDDDDDDDIGDDDVDDDDTEWQDDDDDTTEVVTDPVGTVEIGGGDCECRQAPDAAPATPLAALALLGALVFRRRG